MTPTDPWPEAILLDFFGTLVDYSPSRTAQGFHGTHALAEELGCGLSYDGFLQRWVAVSARFDARSAIDHSEFSMLEVGHAFLHDVRGRSSPGEAEALVERYIEEWRRAVVPFPGVAGVLRALAGRCRLVVASNTHHPTMVPDLLDEMGVGGLAGVVLSVDVGWRKPHPRFYERALEVAGVPASRALFVGDTRDADHDGPRAAGMQAWLVDPQRRHDVPDGHRLRSVADLVDRLAPTG